MSNYDSDVLGVGNPMHPANQEDCQEDGMTLDKAIDEVRDHFSSEVAQTIEDHVFFLELEIKRFTERSKALKSQLKKLAEFEQSMTTFGNLTHEENIEKLSILEQHQ